MNESEWWAQAEPNPGRYTPIGRIGTLPDCWWCRDCGCLVADHATHEQMPHPAVT